MTNALAYYSVEIIRAVIGFILNSVDCLLYIVFPGASVIKLFMAVSYRFP